MKLFQDAMLAGLYIRGINFVPKDEKGEFYATLGLYLNRTKKKATFVVDALDWLTYNINEMVSSGKQVRIASPNKHDLNKLYQSPNLEAYLLSERIESFGIFDNRSVFYETYEGDFTFLKREEALVKKYNKIFQEITKESL